MDQWEKIEQGWYRHEAGAIVRRWGNYSVRRKTGWFAWRQNDSEEAGQVFKTMREARQYCLAPNLTAPDTAQR